jgi:hypothetical protein
MIKSNGFFTTIFTNEGVSSKVVQMDSRISHGSVRI